MIRTFLSRYKFVLVAALATGISLADISAVRAESLSLSAEGPWNMQLFSAEEAQGIPFCTIQKSFDEQYGLFVSLNPMHAMKLILDVPEGKFTAGRKYSASITLRDGTQKTFKDAMLVEGDFDFSIFRDEPMFQAIRQSDRITITLDDVILEFSANDFPKAMSDLEACVRGQALLPKQDTSEVYAAPAKAKPLDHAALMRNYQESQALIVGETPPSDVLVPPAPKLSLSDKELLESLKKKIVLLEKEKESLRSTIAEQRQGELSTLKQTIDQSGVSKACADKLSALEKQVGDLQTKAVKIEKVAESKDATPTCPSVPTVQPVYPAANPNQDAEVEMLKQKIAELTSQNSNLVASLATEKSRVSGLPADEGKKLAAMQQQIEVLKAENATLVKKSQESAKIAAPAVSANVDVSALEKRLGAAEQQSAALAAQLKEAESKLASATKTPDADDNSAALKQAQERTAALEKDIGWLQDENRKLADEVRNASSASGGACPQSTLPADAQRLIDQLRQQNAAYERQIGQCQE